MKNFRKNLSLVLTRIRPSLGNTGVFLFIYGAYSSAIYDPLFYFVMAGYLLIHNAGDFLNDKYDYPIDLKNQREDKLTINKVFTPEQMSHIAIILYTLGFIVIAVATVIRGIYTMLLAALYFMAILTIYSLPSFKLRRQPIVAYFLSSSTFAVIPFLFAPFFHVGLGSVDLVYSAMIFFQFTYILVQKDITDKYDKRGVFAVYGKSTSETLMLILSASVFVLLLWFAAKTSFLVIPFAIINLSVKLSGWYYSRYNSPKRRIRIVFVTMDYLSLFMCGLVLSLV